MPDACRAAKTHQWCLALSAKVLVDEIRGMLRGKPSHTGSMNCEEKVSSNAMRRASYNAMRRHVPLRFQN